MAPYIESVNFNRRHWTAKEAQQWLQDRDCLSRIEIQPHHYRFGQGLPRHPSINLVHHRVGSASKPIDLILGYPRLGSGIISTIRKGIAKFTPNFLKPRAGKTDKFKKFLNEHEDDPIVAMKVGRKPVNKGISTVMNVLSTGKFNRKVKELGYDDVYHNYIVVTLKSGRSYKIERNHVISDFKATSKDFENTYDIPLHGKDLNVKSLITNADVDHVYDPGAENCQDFVQKVVYKNGLDAGLNHETQEVIKPQDGQALIASLEDYSPYPKLLTDVANVGTHLTGIGGKIPLH